MATLLDGSTFNDVRVWGGTGGAITNTIVGYCAGDSIAGGYADNTIFGFKAGRDIQDAAGNSIMGANAVRPFGGPAPGDVKFNVVMGACAMSNANPPFSYNTAIGYETMRDASNDCYNTAIGHQSMRQAHGQKNTFVGFQAGCGSSSMNAEFNVGIGKYALYKISNGTKNVAIGYKALYGVTNGNGNIAIGDRSGANIVNADNTIAIGYKSTTSDNNGHTAAGSACVSCFRLGAGSWTNLSDRRDKSDIELLPDSLGLNFVRSLRPVKFNFDYRQAYVDKCGFEFGVKDGTLKQNFETYGFIAQEMESSLSEIQSHFDALNKDENDNYSLEYENLISPIVKSLQQTIERLEFLESKV